MNSKVTQQKRHRKYDTEWGEPFGVERPPHRTVAIDTTSAAFKNRAAGIPTALAELPGSEGTPPKDPSGFFNTRSSSSYAKDFSTLPEDLSLPPTLTSDHATSLLMSGNGSLHHSIRRLKKQVGPGVSQSLTLTELSDEEMRQLERKAMAMVYTSQYREGYNRAAEFQGAKMTIVVNNAKQAVTTALAREVRSKVAQKESVTQTTYTEIPAMLKKQIPELSTGTPNTRYGAAAKYRRVAHGALPTPAVPSADFGFYEPVPKKLFSESSRAE